MVWKRGGLVAEVCTKPRSRVALLHLDATQPVVLEGTAAVIWDLIDGQRSEQEIFSELEATFEDQSGQMHAQVEGFLAGLQEQRLIEAARGVSH
ncbi:pyrroloquinoline quinone biosynthesis protein D [Arthrobacter sp. SLBN-83]|nr:pyrroloquinoline quinone biosynthesis protein D [Arthrobacter sp. SLBN-83]